MQQHRCGTSYPTRIINIGILYYTFFDRIYYYKSFRSTVGRIIYYIIRFMCVEYVQKTWLVIPYYTLLYLNNIIYRCAKKNRKKMCSRQSAYNSCETRIQEVIARTYNIICLSRVPCKNALRSNVYYSCGAARIIL